LISILLAMAFPAVTRFEKLQMGIISNHTIL
jgi:hypothetical protein